MVLFLVLALPVLVLFAGALVDVIRIRHGKDLAEEALYTSLDSVLADYDRPLRERFGLFAYGGKCYRCRVVGLLRSNLWETSMGFRNVVLEGTRPLNEAGVFKGQMLEEMKVRGLVNFSKEFFTLAKSFADVKEVQDLLGKYGGSREEAVAGLQEEVGSNMETIRGLEARRSAGEAGLDGEIESLYQRNKDLLVLAENLSSSTGSSGSGGGEVSGETWGRLGELFGSELGSYREELSNPVGLFYDAESLGAESGSWLEQGFTGVRDKYLLAEYVLEHFGTYAGGSGEVEEIAGGGSGLSALFRVVLLRSFLDGVGYYSFDVQAPPDPLERLLYSAGMGLAGGALDTLNFVSREGVRVPVVNLLDNSSNPLKGVELSYRDHLELLLLARGEEELVSAVYDKVAEEFPGEWYTGVRCSGEFIVPLDFLDWLPDGFEWMGGVVKDGWFYFNAEVELAYR